MKKWEWCDDRFLKKISIIELYSSSFLIHFQAAAQTREEGFAALQEAEREKSEILKYQEHLKILKDNLETKERNLAEERLNLAKEKKQLEKLRLQLLCVQCQSPIVKDSRPSMNAVNLSNGIHLSAKLLALKIAAEKDMEYLQRESEYLKSLRTPSHANFSVPR